MSQLSGTVARLPTDAVANLNWWRRVIGVAWLFMSILYGGLCFYFAFANNHISQIVGEFSSRARHIIGWTFLGAFLVAFTGITCAFWLSLKVAGDLALHPTDRELHFACCCFPD
jgi:hypothetical protein